MSQKLITDFYQAFQQGDAAGMTACYHDQVEFNDPAFGTLAGTHAKAMWHMLLSNPSSNLQVTFSDVEANQSSGSASWTADYFFGPQRRPVHNEVKAKFTFADGLIVSHHDTFDLWKWSRQALGLSGTLLGWSTFMRNKVQTTTNARLKKWMAQNRG